MAEAKTFEKYGAHWRNGTAAIAIEMACIRKGGEWLDGGGNKCGLGLFHHYREFQKILWPEDDHHRWTDLILSEILNNDITVVMGPSDSGKTYAMVRYALSDFWCFPDETLFLISSTDQRGLELRIWGWMKILFNRAKEKFPWLRGSVLESTHSIAADKIIQGGDKGRAINKGLICVPCIASNGTYVGLGKFIGIKPPVNPKTRVPGRLRHIGDEVQCFISGTEVDTPSGSKEIQEIKVGDEVKNAIGTGRVLQVFKSKTRKLIRINTRDGRSMVCTPNHKVFTLDGWKMACEVNRNQYMVSSYEAMSILRGESLRGKEKEGRKKDRFIDGAWVESVEVLQPKDFEQFGGSEEGVKVYNLCVSGHPSYSVEGLLVHNCMSSSFLDAYANWYGKPNFKGIMSGNPIDPLDCLGKAAEPVDGWNAQTEPTKTTTWRTRFYDGTCVNLVGTDSPNFDYPTDTKPRFDYLTSQKKIDAVIRTYSKNSPHYYTQCVGVMKSGLLADRVLTRDLCRQHGAHGKVTWDGGTPITKIYACDPAYGGGDRCVGGYIEFGKELGGRNVICVHPPEVIPISLKLADSPEDQIANFVHRRLQELDIPAENSFYDSFGKGTVGFSFARMFGHSPPVPVDSGGMPTERPVRLDLFLEENGKKRVKLCSEHYKKFVTEMWFSVREVVEGRQMRQLPEEVMEEGCLRVYSITTGNRLEVESKKDMKERIGRSPDLMDWLAIAVEGARRRGFRIERLGSDKQAGGNRSVFDQLVKKTSELNKSQELKAA